MKEKNLSLSGIEQRVYIIRNIKVMLDQDLAYLYGTTTMVLNQTVSRNLERFPSDFMFKLTEAEFGVLKSQIVIAKRGGRRSPLRAFTQEGIAMLSGILRSSQAIQANIAITRAFVHMREVMITHKDLAQRLDAMEKKYDTQFGAVFDALRQLMQPAPAGGKRIGYIHPVED